MLCYQCSFVDWCSFFFGKQPEVQFQRPGSPVVNTLISMDRPGFRDSAGNSQNAGEERVRRGVDIGHLLAAREESASIASGTPSAALASSTIFQIAGYGTNRPFSRAPHYKMTRLIGQGSFAKVFLATHQRTGLNVAVKRYCREDVEYNGHIERVREEARIMWSLSGHPHIVQIYECVEAQECIYIVMEYVSNGDLHYYGIGAGPLPPEDKARRAFQQMISAIEYCHQRGVVHHDLKSENILLDEHGNIKITDFGLSCDIRNGDSTTSSCGTRQYAAPEVFSPGTSHSGRAADVWSCGVILYALLCGRLPFEEANISQLTWRIQNGDYEVPGHLSADAQDLVRRMLQVNPRERITIPEIRQHRFFRPSLPPYIALPAHSYQLSEIDVESFICVVRLGCGASDLLNSIWQLASDQRSNEATVAYFAVLHAKYSRDGHNNLDQLSQQLTASNLEDVQAAPRVPSGAFVYPGTEPRWTIGLQSQNPFSCFWSTVRNILREMGVTWLTEEQCFRYCPPHRAFDPSSFHQMHQRRSLQLKFALELRRVVSTSPTPPSHRYLRIEVERDPSSEKSFCILDLRKREGSSALFHDTCGTILSKLLGVHFPGVD